MKKCPYCAEEIQDEAIKCKHCGEFLEKNSRPVKEGSNPQDRPSYPIKEGPKWYYKMSVFVIAFLCVGPIALPLIWFNPTYNRRKKSAITVIAVIVTIILTIATINSVKMINSYYKQIEDMFPSGQSQAK